MASSVMEPSSPSSELSDGPSQGVPKDWKFWTIIFSLALSILLTAIEFVSRPSFAATPSWQGA
jgi:hypothetical protein